MTDYFTADTHFGHERILTLGPGRPFETIADHDETIIRRHRETVTSDEDTTYFLGDYALGDRSKAFGYLQRMRGRKILVIGNHDTCFLAEPKGLDRISDYLAAGFAAVVPFAAYRLPALTKAGRKEQVWLSHFPYDGDSHGTDRHSGMRLRDEGRTLIHGHVHAEWGQRHSARTRAIQINVGVDRHDYRPVAAEDLARMVAAARSTPSDACRPAQP